jgi:hypothetical protein
LTGAIAQALGISPTDDSPAALVNAMRGLAVNVLLDNADALGPGIASLLRAVAQENEGTRWVVTQPGPLPLPSARQLPLGPLPLPQAGQGLVQMRRSAALALLDARCSALDSRRRLEDHAPRALLDLCSALDGLPLAIELAAAQCCAMGAEAVVQSLRRAPRVAAPAAAHERHHGIDHAAAWSIAMCMPQERQALAALSICRGGFSLSFATDLLETLSPGCDAPALLARLVAHGMVARSGRAAWYGRLLETIRHQALALLHRAGNAAQAAAAHAQVAARRARNAWSEHWVATERQLCADHGADLDNYRAALEWSNGRSPLQALEIAAALSPLWRCLSLHNEGLRALATAEANARAARVRIPQAILAHARLAAALLHSESGGDEGRVAAQRAAAVFRRLRDPRGEYLALALWLYSFRDLGPPARRRAFARMRSLEHPHWSPMLRLFGARVESPALEGASAVAAARCAQEQRLGLAREAGSAYETESALVSLADLALLAGDVHEAVRRNRDLLARLGPRNQASRMVALGNLLEGLCLLGRFGEGRAAARQFAVEAPRLGYQFGMFAVYALGVLCVAQDRVEEGAMLLAWGDDRYARERRDRGPNEERLRTQLRERLAGRIEPREWPGLCERASRLAPASMIALAVGEDLASTALDSGPAFHLQSTETVAYLLGSPP